MLIVGASLTWFAKVEYDQTLEREFRFLEAHARIADAHLSGLFRNIDYLLRDLAAERETLPPAGRIRFENGLAERLRDFPEVRTLLIVDANGHVEMSNRPETKKFDLSNREYFTIHRDSAQAPKLFVSPPFKSKIGATTITFSRALRDSGRKFQGVVAAGIDPIHLDNVMRSIKPDDSGSAATLFNTQGDVLYRLPDPGRQFGGSLAGGKMFQEYMLSKQTYKRFMGTGSIDPAKRLFVFRRIGDSSHIVSVSSKLDAVLAEWRYNVILRVLMFFLAAAVTFFLTWTAQRRQKEILAGKMITDQLIHSALDAVVRMDSEGRISGWNPQSEKIFGWPEQEAIGRMLHETIIPPRNREAHLSGLKRFLESGASSVLNTRVEIQALHRDGHEFPVELAITQIQIPGAIKFSAFIRDISERRVAEEQLRLLAKVFESGSDAFLITDTDNNILAVNPSFTELTGYTREEVLGRNPRILSSGHESGEFYAEMWRSLQTTGHWQGEVRDRRKNGEIYPKWLTIDVLKDEHGTILNYIASFSDITERKRADERIRHLAQHDILTGLPNRALLSDRLSQAFAQAKRNPFQFAVLFLDLDRFKNINDSLGHHVGDQLLQEVAKRLLASVRETDTVCRQGGDEFIVLVLDLDGPERIALIAGKILTALSQPYLIGGSELNLTPSIGIASYPLDGDNEEDIVKNADTAMYHAKGSGRGQYQFFTEKLSTSARDRLQIENDLRKALERNEFILHYQPKLDIATRKISGCEALVRWHHPEQGLMAPGRFIPIAEESGLIVAIGDWVLEAACREGVRLQSAGLRSLVMSVNVSALQLKQADYVERVLAALLRTGLDPSLLELEVTESMIMHDVENVTGILRRLNDAGIQLAVDDFGTGYSSLAYLKRFPIHMLKIDQSFVRDIMTDKDDAAIVQAIIALAHSLRLGVIAEGVETQEQFDFLEAHGCNSIQGYLIAKPLPIEEFLKLA